MSKRLKQTGVVLVVIFAAAQLIRPERTNPPTDASRTIQAHIGAQSELAQILARACGDCHSNQTVWPWYTRVAPLSWLMARGASEGRKAVNFSDWAGYSSEQQHALLAVSCEDVSSGKMPGLYTLVRSETRLSPKDVDTICAAAHEADPHTTKVSP